MVFTEGFILSRGKETQGKNKNIFSEALVKFLKTCVRIPTFFLRCE